MTTSPRPWSTYRSSGNDEVVLSADNKPVALNCTEGDALLIAEAVNNSWRVQAPERNRESAGMALFVVTDWSQDDGVEPPVAWAALEEFEREDYRQLADIVCKAWVSP